jgi:hypothetical protein
MEYHDQVAQAAAYIQERFLEPIPYGIILGTGLGNLGNQMEVIRSLDYKEIPHFPHLGRKESTGYERPFSLLRGIFHEGGHLSYTGNASLGSENPPGIQCLWGVKSRPKDWRGHGDPRSHQSFSRKSTKR